MMTEQILEPNEVEEEKRKQAEQDVRINEDINATATMIANVREHPEAAAILAEHGYGGERLDDGIQLCERTRTAFHQRSAAITAQRYATASLAGFENTARMMYSDFRLVARGLYPVREAHAELGLSGLVPRDRNKFLGSARMSIAAASRDPYAPRFTEFGYNETTLSQINEALDALDRADTTQNKSIADAMEATAIRDSAHAELNKWLQQFRRVAVAALRHDPVKMKMLEV